MVDDLMVSLLRRSASMVGEKEEEEEEQQQKRSSTDAYHVFTCASVILSPLASWARSAEARYFCLWKRRSSSVICWRVNEVLGFLRFGGVRFW